VKNILIIEDNQDIALLVAQITGMVIPNVTIIHTSTSEEAIHKIEWAEFIITDFNFPTEGFLGLLPTIKKANRKFVLQTAEPSNIKVYDPTLQLAAIRKGADFVPQMMSVLRSI
jgi:DNA-binding NtrC family response regulator